MFVKSGKGLPYLVLILLYPLTTKQLLLMQSIRLFISTSLLFFFSFHFLFLFPKVSLRQLKLAKDGLLRL